MITLITASFKEIEHFVSHCKILEHYSVNSLKIKDIELNSKLYQIVQSGVGIKNARIAASYAINNLKSEKIFITGVAGALTSELNIGDIIVSDWVYSIIKDERINLNPINDKDLSGYITGGLLTHNRFVNTSTAKNELKTKSKAIIVDMETWGAAEVCKKFNIPIYSIRSVSDLASDSLPDFGYIYNSNGRLKTARALKYFTTNPYLFYKYLEFRFIKLKKSSCSLSAFLLQLFNKPLA